MKWRFVEHHGYPGEFHMAVDEMLLDRVGRGQSPPTFRVYTWTPSAISLGRSQRQGALLDRKRCCRAGVDVVVRPSGGRAVLHGDDVTYSAVFPVDGTLGAGGIGATYKRLAVLLLRALRVLGIEAEVARSRASDGTKAALPCFTAAARDEILVEGRKLIGSAQRRTRSAVLQHGAILVGGNQADLASFVADEEAAWGLRRSLTGRTVTVEEVLGRRVSFAEVARALKLAAGEVFGGEITHDELSQDEKAAIRDSSRYGREMTA